LTAQGLVGATAFAGARSAPARGRASPVSQVERNGNDNPTCHPERRLRRRLPLVFAARPNGYFKKKKTAPNPLLLARAIGRFEL